MEVWLLNCNKKWVCSQSARTPSKIHGVLSTKTKTLCRYAKTRIAGLTYTSCWFANMIFDEGFKVPRLFICSELKSNDEFVTLDPLGCGLVTSTTVGSIITLAQLPEGMCDVSGVAWSGRSSHLASYGLENEAPATPATPSIKNLGPWAFPGAVCTALT